MSKQDQSSAKGGFRHFFLRGLAILLPSILTVWILFVVYQFVQQRIAYPINQGIKTLVVRYTDLPITLEEDMDATATRLRQDGVSERQLQDHVFLHETAQRHKLEQWWGKYAVVLDLIGLLVAILVIYIAGALLGSFIGRRLYARGEHLISRLPLVKLVYPSVKQVTEFLVGSGDEDEKRTKFNRVVAVQYPRKGIWSVGLVTGNTMHRIEEHAGQICLTIFIPSSPTPFTGYVITVPQTDTIDLPVTIEEALRFTVSLGVVVPPSQLIRRVPSEQGGAKRMDEPAADKASMV